MHTPDVDARPVADFALLVERFCVLIEGHAAMRPDEFLRRLHVQLAQIYAAALVLPAVEVIGDSDSDSNNDEHGIGDEIVPEPAQAEATNDGMGHDAWMVLYHSLAALVGAHNHYFEIFDAYAEPPEEPLVGNLADDLADIYRNLNDGLVKWQRGEKDNALWEWRFHFTSHWGEHATSALRALHVLASMHDLGFGGKMSK